MVTGASSGIGAACAHRLDRLGFQVFAGVRRPADGDALARTTSPRLTPLLLEVTTPESIAAAAALVADRVGSAGLAGLVNNAGIVVAGPLELQPLVAVRRQLEVNTLGPLAVTLALVGGIIEIVLGVLPCS